MQEKCYLQNYWFYYIYQEETEQKEAQREGNIPQSTPSPEGEAPGIVPPFG